MILEMALLVVVCIQLLFISWLMSKYAEIINDAKEIIEIQDVIIAELYDDLKEHWLEEL